ncbi:universal stress protein [Natrinema sp. 1APR25-10V2]|uniref:universal stress protein n=1 Tax=Natrinema sp. 1APR25-10V2 TaxID=2951081 RepID=UPI002874F1FA|nr:universal stress protein [Natrinema sp. 1APR25-10V2]MDS0477061.1 universal stress protein [Natrinema sp. 1APR25-10V2]
MSRTTLLVPIRYPPQEASVQTMNRAIDFAEQFDDAHVLILHVNVRHKGDDVDRTEFRRTVKDEIEPPTNASYHVRDAYLIEKAILDEASQQNADYVVIGKSMRSRWQLLLADRLGIGIDIETFLDRRLDTELRVI